MTDNPEDEHARPPRAEVEIIPPGQRGREGTRDGAPVWTARQRVYIAKPGPFAFLLGLVVLGALALVAFLVFIGFFLLWIPVLGIMVAAVLLSAIFRGPRRL